MMEINGNVITLEAGEEITIKAREKEVEPQPEPQPEPEPKPEPVGKYISFGDLLNRMSIILGNYKFKGISQQGTPRTFAYLKKVDDEASKVWDAKDSWMFDEKTYYRGVYTVHGSDKSHKYDAANSLGAWAMASCLAELCPTSGEATNCQTDLFLLAYSLAGGRSVPITGLDVHCDPMVSRSVACLVHDIVRANYSFADIAAMRAELGSKPIPASDFDGLGYKSKDGKMTYLGYLVNTDKIIPSAPGWYADGWSERAKPYEQGQPRDLFYIDNCAKDWYKDNYKFDCAIDARIVDGYQMNATTPLEVWNSYSKDKKLMIIKSACAVRATDHFFFGRKYIKFDGIHKGSRYGQCPDEYYFWFSVTSEKPTVTNDVFDVSGCFGDLQDKMFVGSGYGTPTDALKYFNTTMKTADNGRYSTYHNQYGRVRPCGGKTLPTSARSPILGDKLNAIYNVDLSCIFCDSQEEFTKVSKQGGFVYEHPKSYPSGHTTQTWVAAMLLGLMIPETLQKYVLGAGDVAVSRNITRYHWCSDVIYGRMIGTMMLPIINAMSGLQSSFERAKAIVNGTTPTPSPSGKTPGTVISFTFKIKNNSGKSVTIDDKVNFVIANPDNNGFYYGANGDGTPYKGYYNRWSVKLVGDGKKITIAAGKEVSFTLKPSDTSTIFNADGSLYGNNVTNGFGGRNLVSKAQMDKNGWNKDRGYTNVLLYQDGYSNKVVPDFMDSNIVFEQGKTYTCNIG